MTNSKICIQKNNKIKWLFVLFAMLFVGIFSPIKSFAGQLAQDPQITIPSANDLIDSKYSFIAQFIPGQTEVVPFDGSSTINWKRTRVSDGSDLFVMNVPVSGSAGYNQGKGRFGVLYKNVGRYGQDIVDLKITIMDWGNVYEGFGSPQIPQIFLGRNQIELNSTVAPVRVRMDYLKHNTQQPINVSGFMTINDLDYSQAVEFSNDSTNHIDRLYSNAAASQFIGSTRVNGKLGVYARWATLTESNDTKAMFTFLYQNANNLEFTWNQHTKTWFNTINSGQSSEAAIQAVENAVVNSLNKSWSTTQAISDISHTVNVSGLTEITDDGGIYFGYIAKKPAKTAPIPPSKTVSDSNEKEVQSNTLGLLDEGYEYNVYQTVPDEWKDFYYSSYILSDEINEVLDVKRVKIYNEQKTDVSGNFNVTSEKNAQGKTIVKAEAKNDFLKSSSFYNHTYQMIIGVSIHVGADLSPYTDKDGNTKIPNKASVTIDNNSESSNEVDTNVKEEKPSAEKFVEIGNVPSKSGLVEYNTNFKFLSNFKTPNYTLTHLELFDDLEDVLELAGARVLDSKGNDITSDGVLTMDKNSKKVSWKATSPNKYTLTTLSLEITCQLQPGTDISKYEDNKIPNIAHMTINDKDVPTDEVVVKPSLPPINVTIPNTGSNQFPALLMGSITIILIGSATSFYFVKSLRRKEK